MNSNWDLDQAAAIILCSAEAAESAGVSQDRWLFPHSGTDGADTKFVSNRADLHSSPAIRVAGQRAMQLAGVTPDDLDHVDLYSCFPSAVQIAATELGLGVDRQLTQTGGLTFAGGPLNNYVTHSIATMANVLRDDPGSIGLCSANGGYITKHAFGVYSATPPASGFQHQDCQEEINTFPSVELDADHTGHATIEAYTVMHGAEGPERGLAALRTSNGRQWATTSEPELMNSMMDEEHVGRSVEVLSDFTFELT
jgi:acetyl-CoA C-acetyltransferase